MDDKENCGGPGSRTQKGIRAHQFPRLARLPSFVRPPQINDFWADFKPTQKSHRFFLTLVAFEDKLNKKGNPLPYILKITIVLKSRSASNTPALTINPYQIIEYQSSYKKSDDYPCRVCGFL